MKIAVIGGGINGLSSAWQLALAGHEVSLFERDSLMQATSSASSKLLHGGLRYLEQGEFRLVREALQERRWWLKKAPQLTRRLPILYPLYNTSRRARWQLKIGLWLYDTFAGRKGIGRHRWLTAEQALRCSPQLKPGGLNGAYLFFDGQMDDQKLGLWMAEQCRKAGVKIVEHSPVIKIQPDGELQLGSGKLKFAKIINVAGPWSSALLQQSGLPAAPLDLVRGSHLLLPAISRYGHMLEVPGEARIVFVLPYQGKTLLGTTEVRQRGVVAIAKEALELLIACDQLYISFDVDSLDSSISVGTGTPVPNGLTVEEAIQLNAELIKDKRVCCWEIVEVNPTLDTENTMAEIAFDVLEITTKSLVDNF